MTLLVCFVDHFCILPLFSQYLIFIWTCERSDEKKKKKRNTYIAWIYTRKLKKESKKRSPRVEDEGHMAMLLAILDEAEGHAWRMQTRRLFQIVSLGLARPGRMNELIELCLWFTVYRFMLCNFVSFRFLLSDF